VTSCPRTSPPSSSTAGLKSYLVFSVMTVQAFYEDVGEQPIYIRGAYFVGRGTGRNKFIDFFILDPNNKVVYSRRKSEEGIFRFNTTTAGTYTFVLSNMKVARVADFGRTGGAARR